MTQSTRHPRLKMKPSAHKRLKSGHPWVYSNEVDMDAAAKALAPGSVVTVTDAGGAQLATAHFNPRTLIAARLLSAKGDTPIDAAFVGEHLRRALALRERLFAAPFYRLIHAEADGLPGLIVDRFGDSFVVQPNTAGMDALSDMIATALRDLGAKTVIVRGEGAARALEGLEDNVRCAFGNLDGPVPVEENGVTFYADLMSGQKTGWFFDQRDNHAFMASMSKGASVLDLYTHTGGFALPAAKAGAKEVLGVDRSAPALELAAKAAKANGVTCAFEKAEVFPFLDAALTRKATWDVVIGDPPAFVKSRKDMKVGLQGYRKLARMCAGVTAPGGLLFMASCSHNAPLEDFTAAVARGVTDASRNARIIRTSGAAPDHPVHPFLPESAYLKAVVLQLD
ncbi:MAG: class I SAM-dependent rRNA methyltransferase [Rhodospirillaceae bacterium]|nr:class I SAM-dependent rRNA methyltransferase [Rhodospirillaceae bacterium]